MPAAAADALTFAGRARALGDGAVRLQASAGTLAMTSAPLAPRGLFDSTPTVLGDAGASGRPRARCATSWSRRPRSSPPPTTPPPSAAARRRHSRRPGPGSRRRAAAGRAAGTIAASVARRARAVGASPRSRRRCPQNPGRGCRARGARGGLGCARRRARRACRSASPSPRSRWASSSARRTRACGRRAVDPRDARAAATSRARSGARSGMTAVARDARRQPTDEASDRGGGRPARDAAGEEASADERALERAVAVHAAAAEAARLARGVQARRRARRPAPSARADRSVSMPPSDLRVRTCSFTAMSGPAFGSRMRCGVAVRMSRSPRYARAERSIAIWASFVKSLSISRSRASTSSAHALGVEHVAAGERLHPGDELVEGVAHDEVGALVHERLHRARGALAETRLRRAAARPCRSGRGSARCPRG